MLLEKFRKAHLPETEFPEFVVDPETCTRCGRCVQTCPTMGLAMEEGGLPYLRGYRGIETACMACWNCEAVCPTGAARMRGVYRVKAGRYKTILPGKLVPPNPFHDPEPPPFEKISRKLTPVERLILKRRSTRLFRDKPVPREKILRILEAGRFAPSATNCTPWQFVVMNNRQMIREMETDCLKVLRPLRDVTLGTRGVDKAATMLLSMLYPRKVDQRSMLGVDKAEANENAFHFNAPVVIFIVADTRGINSPELDTGICGQNMVLAAHAMGLGACFVGLTVAAIQYLPKWKQRLGVEPPWKVMVSLSVGYPKGKIDRPVARETPEVRWLE